MSRTATFISSTQLTMALSPTDLAAPGYFAVVVNNQATGGAIANSVFFTVNDATPACGSEPKSQSVTAPASATFCISPPGTGSPSYQWYKNGTPISGATSSSYTTPPTTWGTNGASYTVAVTDGGSVTTTSPAVLTVYPTPTVDLAPVGPVLIGGQPQSQTVVKGTNATLNEFRDGLGVVGSRQTNNQCVLFRGHSQRVRRRLLRPRRTRCETEDYRDGQQKNSYAFHHPEDLTPAASSLRVAWRPYAFG
jgi:hypothetical protein